MANKDEVKGIADAKMDPVADPTAGNLVVVDEQGQVADSGIDPGYPSVSDCTEYCW